MTVSEDGVSNGAATQHDHPIRQGAMLRCVSEMEQVERLVEVNRRYRALDDDHIEYQLTCPTRTGYYQYREEDVNDLFTDTGLTNEEPKPVMQEDIRELYQDLCDHSWHETVSGGFHCTHCRMSVRRPDDDMCSECRTAKLVDLLPPEDEVSELVCTRHGVLKKVSADG